MYAGIRQRGDLRVHRANERFSDHLASLDRLAEDVDYSN